MTKAEVLKTIDQNRDLLTAENYQRIIKQIDLFTEDEKQRIVDYLNTAQRMLAVNHEFMQKQNALLKQTGDSLNTISYHLQEEKKQVLKQAENTKKNQDDSAADSLLSNL
ncbi:hypothetical protein IPJ72_05175 [Candidatus Peregrinibacteria bacterium]|nr:MAG: hypothetical protein IPJ72_05175 [Candidatus Peregrinibacteria bacterium]